jgi:hypothetical protein
MSPEAELRYRIRRAERLLPGWPAPEGKTDWRWQAIIKMGYYIPDVPEPIWEFVAKWGRHPQADLRTAVAVCLLEHLLEQHFLSFFPRVHAAALNNKRFKDTLRRCYWMGEAAWPPNARRLDALAGIKGLRISPCRPKPPREAIKTSAI